ncbi:unnamed protein product [Trichobilharzia szidati]|nr:unnamed protein product [Trichobilharzia szidati]
MKQKSDSIISCDLTGSTNNYTSSDNSNCFNDNGNLSPTAINLLPKNLLDSPVSNDQQCLQSPTSPLSFMKKQKKSYFQIPVMKLKSNENNIQVQMFSDDNNTGTITTSDTMSNTKISKSNNNCFKGFYLKTTKSNIKFIIEDPCIIENLILLPMTHSFIHLSKKFEWDLKNIKSNFNFNKKGTVRSTNLSNISSSSSSSNYVTDDSSSSLSSSTPPPSPNSFSLSHQHMINHSKHILFKLYEDYLETYGYSKRSKLFVKYAMRNFPECEEKTTLLKLLKKHKLSIDSFHYSYELPKDHIDNNNNDMFYETSGHFPKANRLSSYSSSSSDSGKSFSSLSPSSISALYSPQYAYQHRSFLTNDYHQGSQYYNYPQYNESCSPELFDDYSVDTSNTLPFEYLTHIPSKVTSSNLLNHKMQTSNILTRFNFKKAKTTPKDDKQNKRAKHLNIRYKSQVCKHFEERDGYCPVGSKCHFAHGNEELRDPKSHPKFRSQLCRYYSTTGYCFYGDNCYFKHSIEKSSPQSEDITSETVKNKENLSPESTSHKNKQFLNSKKKKTQKENKLHNSLK